MANLAGLLHPRAPRALGELVDPAPSAGAGLHRWAFYAANAARGYGFSARDAAAFVLDAMQRAGRPQREAERETRHAIERTYGLARVITQRAAPAALPTPFADWKLMEDTARAGPGLVDLWEASPCRFDTPQAAEIYRALMGPEPEALVCIAKAHPGDAVTLPLADALPLVATHALTCQNRMSAPTGLTLAGKTSPRTLANCGPRRWAVVEFDPDPEKPEWQQFTAPLDAMAAFIWKLHELAGGLAVVTHSGGKSLHGWFKVRSAPAATKLYAAALKFGADPATRTANQLVRIPDGRRADGRRQAAYYFNPTETETA